MCFIAAPFIAKEIVGEEPKNPVESILSVKQAAINFNNTHLTNAGFKNIDTTTQAKRFAILAYSVTEGYIEETSFKIEPDDEELLKYCNERHLNSQQFPWL
jgi:hypothetical protein